MKTFLHDNRTIAYRDQGSGDSIVMLHNGGTSSAIWRDQFDALADRYRVAAVDLPGFGSSPLPATPASLDDLVELIAAFISERDLAPALVVGNCMGSNIAVLLSRRHPELVTGVLAINPLTAASFSGGGLGFFHTMQRVAAAPTRVVRKLSRKITPPKLSGSSILRFQLGPKGVARGLHHDSELLACQVRAEQLPALIDVLDDMDAYGQLDTDDAAPTVPIWIAWGDKNRVLSRRRAEQLPERLHATRVEVLDGCGHLAMMEDPDAVTDLIVALLAEVSPSTVATGARQ